MLSPKELEALADHLLASDFSDNRKNKSQLTEFPILSPSQLKRRLLAEIPYSNLSEKQRVECRSKNLDYYPREGD